MLKYLLTYIKLSGHRNIIFMVDIEFFFFLLSFLNATCQLNMVEIKHLLFWEVENLYELNQFFLWILKYFIYGGH